MTDLEKAHFCLLAGILSDIAELCKDREAAVKIKEAEQKLEKLIYAITNTRAC